MKLNAWVYICVGVVTLLSGLSPWPAEIGVASSPKLRLEGFARIVSGSEIAMDGRIVRLTGINAPMRNQECRDNANQTYPCGRLARAELNRIIQGAEVTCTTLPEQTANRVPASCFVKTDAGKMDLAAAMLEAGWASVDQTVGNKYWALELDARETKRGMWAY